MNGLDKIFIFLILARVQNFAHSQSLIANLTAVFNFSLPGSGDEYSEASGESNVFNFAGASCDFGTKVIGPPGFNLERSSVNGFCSSDEVCGTFNSSVLVNVSGVLYPGVLVIGSCFTRDWCEVVGCREARLQSLSYVIGLQLSPNIIDVNDDCSRSCCDANSTCTTIRSSQPIAPPSTTTTSQSSETVKAKSENQTQVSESFSRLPPPATTVTETTLPNPLPCGFDGYLRENTLTIQSPGYPRLYAPNELCEWQIRTKTPGNRIRIDFQFISTEPIHDTLEIFEPSSERRETYSGESNPAPYLSVSNSVLIRFRSDISIQRVGFQAFVQEMEKVVAATQLPFNTADSNRPPQEFPCQLGAVVVGLDGRAFDLYHLNGSCSNKLLCSSFNSSVLFNQTGDIYEGTLSVTTCISPTFCPQVTCDGVRGLVLSDPSMQQLFLHVEESCSRRCCDFNNTCTEIPTLPANAATTATSQSTALPLYLAGSLLCGFNGSINESPSTIVTPGWPVAYNNFEHCEWELHANTHGYILEIVFESFDTENTFDYLIIIENNREVARYSGPVVPVPFSSTSSSIVLRFVSDPNVQRQGIRLSVKELAGPTQAPPPPPSTEMTQTSVVQLSEVSCGFNASVNQGPLEITSPGWPGVYGNNEMCEWRIRAHSTGYRIELEFTAFNIEYAFDFVDVYEGTHRVAIYTGGSIPPPLLSNSTSLLMRFRSDSSLSLSGFRAVVREISPSSSIAKAVVTPVLHTNITTPTNEAPQQVTTEASATTTPSLSLPCGSNIFVTLDPVTIRSPNYPNPYGYNEACEWRFRASTPGNHLVFEIIFIETEFDYDFVTGFEDDQVVFLHSGLTIPDPYVSITSFLHVRFTSDSTISMRGFEATVREQISAFTTEVSVPDPLVTLTPPALIPCGYNGSVTQGLFIIQSPNYPNSYENNILCNWHFHVSAPGYRIVLEFISIATEANYDVISGFENGSLVFRFSGLSIPDPYVSSTSSLHIQFASDQSISGTGFEATIRELIPPSTTDVPIQTSTANRTRLLATETSAFEAAQTHSSRNNLLTGSSTKPAATLPRQTSRVVATESVAEVTQLAASVPAQLSTTDGISARAELHARTADAAAVGQLITKNILTNSTQPIISKITFPPTLQHLTSFYNAAQSATNRIIGATQPNTIEPKQPVSTERKTQAESTQPRIVDATAGTTQAVATESSLSSISQLLRTTEMLSNIAIARNATIEASLTKETELYTRSPLASSSETIQPTTTTTEQVAANSPSAPLVQAASRPTALSTSQVRTASTSQEPVLPTTLAPTTTFVMSQSSPEQEDNLPTTTEIAQSTSASAIILPSTTAQPTRTERPLAATATISSTSFSENLIAITETNQAIAVLNTTLAQRANFSAALENAQAHTLQSTNLPTTEKVLQRATTEEAIQTVTTEEITQASTIPDSFQIISTSETTAGAAKLTETSTTGKTAQDITTLETAMFTTAQDYTTTTQPTQAITDEITQLPPTTDTTQSALASETTRLSITEITDTQVLSTTQLTRALDTVQPSTTTEATSTLAAILQTTISQETVRTTSMLTGRPLQPTVPEITPPYSTLTTQFNAQPTMRSTLPDTMQPSTSIVTTNMPALPEDERFLPSCSVSHAVNSIFRCQYIFASTNVYRGPATCRNEVNDAIRCVGRELAQCRLGGLKNVLDSYNLPLFNSKTILTLLHNLSLQTGDRINNNINAFCFHAGLNLPFPYRVGSQLEGCQPGSLAELLRRVKTFYYRYTWARNRSDICRAFRRFKQWFLDASATLCDFGNLSKSPNYPPKTARYLSNVARIVLRTLEKLEISSCQESADEFDFESAFNMFGCQQT